MKINIEINEDEMEEVLSLILNRFEICSILNELDMKLRGFIKYDADCFDGEKMRTRHDICEYTRGIIYEIQDLMKNN